jgi:hypothetical protein
MLRFWSRYRRGTAAALLACWIWFSTGAAYTHACAQSGDHDNEALRTGIACVVCQWMSVEKSTDACPAPAPADQPRTGQVFAALPEARPFIPSFVLPGRAPPA